MGMTLPPTDPRRARSANVRFTYPQRPDPSVRNCDSSSGYWTPICAALKANMAPTPNDRFTSIRGIQSLGTNVRNPPCLAEPLSIGACMWYHNTAQMFAHAHIQDDLPFCRRREFARDGRCNCRRDVGCCQLRAGRRCAPARTPRRAPRVSGQRRLGFFRRRVFMDRTTRRRVGKSAHPEAWTALVGMLS
jgi:hypothetical protein